jgi:chromosome partitioning protein
MFTITLLNQKGGGGKSTICQALAVAAHLDGHSVAILDIDPQGSTYSWGKRRASYASEQGDMDPDPIVLSVTIANLQDEWHRLKSAGADFVFIDTPARLNAEAGDAAKLADLVLVPSKATIKDLERVIPSIKLANVEGVKPTCVVLNAVRPQAARGDEAEEFIKSQKFPVCPARVGNLVAFEDADALGLTPQEMEPNGRAAEDIRKVYKYTSGLVEQSTRRKVEHHDQAEAQTA